MIDVDDNGTRGWRDEEVGGRMGAYMLFTWPLDISYVSPAEAARKNNVSSLIPPLCFSRLF